MTETPNCCKTGGVACDYGDVGLASGKGFNHAEAKPAAAANDENVLLLERLHDGPF
jgi:hypothetical protein